MTDRKVVDYNVKHLEQIVNNLRGLERRQLAKVRMDVMEWHNMIIADTPNPKTIMIDEKPVAIGGISTLWKGVGEGWMIGSQDFKKNMFYICKQVRQYINGQIKAMGLTRLQAVVSVGNDDVFNFAKKFLGMSCEGCLHKYGMDGTDQFMFAKWSKE